jgi:hypothetical protein
MFINVKNAMFKNYPTDFDAVFIIARVTQGGGVYAYNMHNIVGIHLSISLAPVRSRDGSLVNKYTIKNLKITKDRSSALGSPIVQSTAHQTIHFGFCTALIQGH